MPTRFEREIYQFLSVYRFSAYALAVLFTQAPFPMSALRMSDLQVILVLSVLGVYSLLKVFSPLRWQAKSTLTYLILAGDFLICLLLVIFTNGLNSAFLLYSLTPIMTAALLFEEKVALSLAAIASLALSLTHLVLSQVISERFSWIMQGHNLTLLIIYTLFSFVSASVPYRINLNIRRRIERDAIIEERRRIRQEIHDGVAQSLSYLNVKTKLVGDSVSSRNTEEAITGLEEIRKVVHDTYEDIREAIDQLSTDVISFPLIPSLNRYIKDFSEKNDIKVEFNIPGDFPRLSPVAELQLLRVIQEAMTNIRRHAQATEAVVKLESDRGAVELAVRDNGRGFSLKKYQDSYAGYHGMDVMRERVESLGGNMQILTAPGEGTEVRVNLPIEKVRL